MKSLDLLVLFVGRIWLLLSLYREVHSASPPANSTIYLLSLLPYPDPDGRSALQPFWDEGPTLYLAAELAVELINNNPDILNGYTLELLQGDSGCNIVSKASNALVENLFRDNRQVLGIIGPGCSDSGLLVSKVVSTDKRDISIPTLHLGGSPLFAKRKKFPYSFSMVDFTDTFANTIIALMGQNNWKNVIVLYDESLIYYTTTLEYFQRNLQSGAAIPVASLVYESHVPFRNIRNSQNRVILLLVGQNLFSRILCLAFRNGFVYPTYQWVFMNQVLDDLRPVSTTYDGIQVNCSLQEMQEAGKQSIFLQYHFEPLDLRKPTDTGLSHKQFEKKYRKMIKRYNRRTHSTLQIQPNFLWAAVYFDTAWAMALALNNSVEELKSRGLDLAQFRYGQNQVTDIVRKQLVELSFEGISGRIKFNTTTGFVSRGINVFQLRNNELKLVMYFNGTNLLQLSKTKLQAIEDNFDNYGTISKVPTGVSSLFMVITMLILILLASFQCISIVYRDSPSVKASSLRLIHMAYLGCYLIVAGVVCASVATLYNSHPERKCEIVQADFLLVFCGMTLIFVTIYVRTWRLYRIFVHFTDPGILISDKVLFSFVCLCLVVELPALLAWGFADPIRPETVQSSSLEFIRIKCTSESLRTWFLSLFSYNATFLLLSCYYALRCNKIYQKDFKSNVILILAYLVTIELTMGVCIYFLLPQTDNPLPNYLTINVTLLLYTVSCWIFLFLPPILPLFQCADRKWHSTKRRSSLSLRKLIHH